MGKWIVNLLYGIKHLGKSGRGKVFWPPAIEAFKRPRPWNWRKLYLELRSKTERKMIILWRFPHNASTLISVDRTSRSDECPRWNIYCTKASAGEFGCVEPAQSKKITCQNTVTVVCEHEHHSQEKWAKAISLLSTSKTMEMLEKWFRAGIRTKNAPVIWKLRYLLSLSSIKIVYLQTNWTNICQV